MAILVKERRKYFDVVIIEEAVDASWHLIRRELEIVVARKKYPYMKFGSIEGLKQYNFHALSEIAYKAHWPM